MIGGLNLLQESNNMQPYQKASEALRKNGEYPINLAKNLGLTAAGGAVGKFGAYAAGALLSKIKPLLNEYVPDNIMEKGLEKVDPRFGKFINGAKEAGFDANEIRSFIDKKTQPPKEDRNIIEMESPELHQTVLDLIRNGKKPFDAAIEAAKNKKFQKNIMKLEKEHKTGWGKLVQTIFGSDVGMPKSGLSRQDLVAQGQQQMQQPQQPGQGQQALMAVMQKINQRLGG